jgi:hypothetical protein
MRILISVLVLVAEKPPWWDVAWSTWGLFVIAFAGTCVAIWTLFLVRRQGLDTKTTAEAALRNAEAVVNSERSWMMVRLEKLPGIGFRMLGDSIQDGPTTSVRFRIVYTNEGKTVAWIDQKLACFQIGKDFPKQPNLDALQLLDAEPEWIGSKGAGYLDETLYAKGHEGMGDISVIWGAIRYRDAFGKHETTFGFSIGPDGRFERIAGFTAYNQNT